MRAPVASSPCGSASERARRVLARGADAAEPADRRLRPAPVGTVAGLSTDDRIARLGTFRAGLARLEDQASRDALRVVHADDLAWAGTQLLPAVLPDLSARRRLGAGQARGLGLLLAAVLAGAAFAPLAAAVALKAA